MFKNTFQSGFLSILYSIGSKPLQIWDKKVKMSKRWQFFLFVLVLTGTFVQFLGQKWSYKEDNRQ